MPFNNPLAYGLANPPRLVNQGAPGKSIGFNNVGSKQPLRPAKYGAPAQPRGLQPGKGGVAQPRRFRRGIR